MRNNCDPGPARRASWALNRRPQSCGPAGRRSGLRLWDPAAITSRHEA